MKLEEAVDWLWLSPSGLRPRLPSVSKWCSENRETVTLWVVELWHDLDVEDCKMVGKQLMAEGVEFKKWEMDFFGATIRRKVKELESLRDRRQSEATKRRQVDRRGSMAQALSTILGGSLSGASRAAVLSQEFPDDTGGPRFYCGLCADSGLITIFDPECVYAAFRLPEDFTADKCQAIGVRIRTAVVACTCSMGTRFAERDPNASGVTLPRLNESHVRAHGCTRKQLASELASALESWRPIGYVKEFDDWK